MKSRMLCLSLAIPVVALIGGQSYGAVESDPDPVVQPNGSGFMTKVEQRQNHDDSDSPVPSEPVGPGPVVDDGCHTATIGGDAVETCRIPDPESDARQVVTAGMVLAAMRRTPLPASELIVEPPNGRTLVNFATNFYVVQPEFTRTMNLLGQQVQLQVWPEQFRWNFGDGQSDVTSEPGAPYPDLEVTHDYLSKGAMRPSVDTTYAAQFRVGGGGWQPVNGTVTIPGASVPLQVVEATPKLVG